MIFSAPIRVRSEISTQHRKTVAMRLNILTAALIITLTTGTAQAQDTFTLTSPDLQAGQTIPDPFYWNSFGCTGENTRPELAWTDVPEGTKSFAVTFYDNDAPTGSGFWHWSTYNIPADETGIGTNLPAAAVENNTDLNQPGFFGPCPPVGRTHTYTYTVYALSSDHLDLPENASAALAGFFYNSNAIATATLDVIAGPRAE